jgi:hypothetical protein
MAALPMNQENDKKPPISNAPRPTPPRAGHNLWVVWMIFASLLIPFIAVILLFGFIHFFRRWAH